MFQAALVEPERVMQNLTLAKAALFQAALVEPELFGILTINIYSEFQAALVEPEPYNARGTAPRSPQIQAYFAVVVGSPVETATRQGDALQAVLSHENRLAPECRRAV